MVRSLLTSLKKIRPICIGLIALRSYMDRKKYYSGDISALGGATTVHRPLEESVAYIRASFEDFNRYAELSPERVFGKRMVELGPGDNLGIGLLYVAWGAAEYIGMDRFYSTHNVERERDIYLALRKSLSPGEQARFDRAVQLDKGIQFNESIIRYHYGTSAEECDTPLEPASIDYVLGRGVLQAADINKAIPAIHRLLKPGGLTCHKVELRDLGMFSHNGYHPLEFLTLTEATYCWMVKGADRPNRRHIHDYRKLLSGLAFSLVIRTACVIDPTLPGYPDDYREVLPHKEHLTLGTDFTQASLDLVRNIRPRLDPHFKSLLDEELMAAGIFFTATKV